jgi:hypothetical protein
MIWHTLSSYVDHTTRKIHRTGAVAHRRRPEDAFIHQIPKVAAAVAVGPPPFCNLSANVAKIYDQGALPCCVTTSICAMKGVEDSIDTGQWNQYDYLSAFLANGGTPQEGVPTRRMLQYVQDVGLKVMGHSERRRIGSYAFTPQEPAAFVSTLKAAIFAKQPAVLAARLPEVFGWSSSGPAIEAYHQVCLVGYDADWAIILNSWGADWGKRGFGRLSWSYLTDNNLQNDDCYAFTCIDAANPIQVPVGKG